MWDEITYPFPNWISNLTPHFTHCACNYLSMLGSKLIHVGKRGPGGLFINIHWLNQHWTYGMDQWLDPHETIWCNHSSKPSFQNKPLLKLGFGGGVGVVVCVCVCVCVGGGGGGGGYYIPPFIWIYMLANTILKRYVSSTRSKKVMWHYFGAYRSAVEQILSHWSLYKNVCRQHFQMHLFDISLDIVVSCLKIHLILGLRDKITPSH